MNRTFVFLAAAVLSLLVCFSSEARRKDKSPYPYGIEVPPTMSLLLYPKGQDVNEGIIENGKAVTEGPIVSNGFNQGQKMDEYGSISYIGNEACINIYLPEKCNGQMMVVCPGGGYWIVSSKNEGTRVAKWCLERNIACCVVQYRLPNHHSVIPLQDVQNAFRYCRAHQAEWGVRQIGVIGFSAGGHLAACASVLYKDAVTKPDWSVLIYPVTTFDTSVNPSGILSTLTEDPKELEYYTPENHVDRNTPKTLLVLSEDDKVVNPENSIRYYQKMIANGVEGELHIFTKGGHGWGFTSKEWATEQWHEKKDGLGEGQRQNFDCILERFLEDRRAEISE